jgi:hypothetical protein
MHHYSSYNNNSLHFFWEEVFRCNVVKLHSLHSYWKRAAVGSAWRRASFVMPGILLDDLDGAPHTPEDLR